MLDRAAAAINEDPGNAIAILDSIPDDGLSHSQRMRRLLLLTNAQNKCDTVYHSDSIQLLLVDYYDRHGSANDRMLAHYLLGRAYYDMGEMPMALNAYQQALADTTGTEQDYYQLARVYMQIANIYYHQNLLEDQIECIDKSVRFAYLAKDTIGAINCFIQKSHSFDLLGMSDSVISICEQAHSMLRNHGLSQQSAQVMALAALHYTRKGELEKAKQCLEIYEAGSGFFDTDHNINAHKMIHYSILGEYYTAIGKLDSAEICFRKELKEGKDFNNQNAASRGLALLYQKIHQPDSAAKYALYSYAMNDSVYAHMATEEVERMKAMYDYSRHQELAYQAERRSAQKTSIIRWGIATFIALIAVTSYLIYRYRRKKITDIMLYRARISELEKTQSDIIMLRQHEDEYEDIISEKEQLIIQLRHQIERFQQTHRQNKDELQSAKESIPMFIEIKRQEACGESLDKKELQQLRQYTLEHYPDFFEFISRKDSSLNLTEFNTCILIRLGYTPKVISNFLNCSPAYISKIRVTLLKKLYGIEDKPQVFDQKIMMLK